MSLVSSGAISLAVGTEHGICFPDNTQRDEARFQGIRLFEKTMMNIWETHSEEVHTNVRKWLVQFAIKHCERCGFIRCIFRNPHVQSFTAALPRMCAAP